MAKTFTINIDSTDFYVELLEIVHTDCADIFSFEVFSTNGNNIDITLTSNAVNSYYISNGGAETTISTSASISFNNTLKVFFAIRNSGNSGYFDSAMITIEDTTTSSTYNTYEEIFTRENDGLRCGEIPSVLQILDEGSLLTSTPVSIDFVGTGVIATDDGSGNITVTITSSTEINDLTAAVVWDDVPDINITESSVTQHEAALSITESQISDLGSYLENIVEDTTPTLGGDLDADSNSIINIDNIEVEGHAYSQEIDNGNSSTADTIDWTAGNFQKSTLTDDCTYTFTAPTGTTTLILKLIQDGTGSRVATFPASVKWSGGTAPTLTTTANAIDIISFYYDGTNYYGGSILDLQ